MFPALIGGVLIGLAASLLWLGSRRIAGVSGIVAAALKPVDGARSERVAFLLGLVMAGFALDAIEVSAPAAEAASAPVGVAAVAGLLVGFGARLGSGCTSGHGICGLSRFSRRSLVATLTFMVTGALTVFVVARFFPAFEVAP
jgi:uncharacterized membrane protein YedE/YeeE